MMNVPSIPVLRPCLNVGAGLDVITGTYHKGRYGESILNGGLSGSQAIQGPPNASKSTILHYFNLIMLERHKRSKYYLFCTEGSSKYERINSLSKRFPSLSVIVHGDPLLEPENVRIIISSQADIYGDEYFQSVKNYAEERIKKKEKKFTTPFLDKRGGHIQILSPIQIAIDSLSSFKVSNIEEKIVDKAKIGDSSLNIVDMREGRAKKRLIDSIPFISTNCGLIFTLTAHVGKEFDLDPYAAKAPKLALAKRGIKSLGTSTTYQYINNFILEIWDAKILAHPTKGNGVLYPLVPVDKIGDGVDLFEISTRVSRSKSGQSGGFLDFVVSQRDGLLPHLSLYHMLRESCDAFGFIGNLQNFSLAILPDVKLSRSVIRGKIDENSDLQRALEITFDLYIINTLYSSDYDHLKCTAEQLYTDLLAMGYDWKILLNTRNYWVFVEDEETELPYLSTMDLLRMRSSEYHPYFLNSDKLTYKEGIKLCLEKQIQ